MVLMFHSHDLNQLSHFVFYTLFYYIIQMDNTSVFSKQMNKTQRGDQVQGALVKSLFNFDDQVQDYYDAPQQVQNKHSDLESPVKTEKQDQLFLGKSTRRNKNNIKLQPLEKEAPRTMLKIGVQKNTNNPEREEKVSKAKRKQQKKREIFDFDSQESEENEEKIQKQQLKKSEERQESLQRPKSKNSENNSAYENEQQLELPFRSMFRRVEPGKVTSFILKRDITWLNRFHPIFHLLFKSNNEYYFSAKKTSSSTQPTYLMAANQEKFEQKEGQYLGKVKHNFTGSLVNIYSQGPNPTTAKEQKVKPRQLLATIEFETNLFGGARPRDFQVYVLRDHAEYYKLDGTTMYEDEIPLSQLYQKPNNKKLIHLLKNKKPEWNQSVNGYMLNFGGRAKKASVKNFILQSAEEVKAPNNEAMVLGKMEQNVYRIDIAAPLSPLIGLGIALSSFGSKIGCE